MARPATAVGVPVAAPRRFQERLGVQVLADLHQPDRQRGKWCRAVGHQAMPLLQIGTAIVVDVVDVGGRPADVDAMGDQRVAQGGDEKQRRVVHRHRPDDWRGAERYRSAQASGATLPGRRCASIEPGISAARRLQPILDRQAAARRRNAHRRPSRPRRRLGRLLHGRRFR